MAEEAQQQSRRQNYDDKSNKSQYDKQRQGGGRQDSRKEGKPVYLEKKPSHNEPATPDIMKGKGQKYPQSKLAQSAVYSSGLENKSPMPKGKGKRNAAEKTVIQPEEEQCLIKSFTNFAKAKDEFFNTVGENPTEETIAEPELNFDHIHRINADRMTPENKPVGGLLICKLLESLFDKKESEFSAYFGTWLEKLIAAKIFYGKDLELGIEQYFKIMGNLECDTPMLSKWFTKYFLFPLVDSNQFDPSRIRYPEADDEMTDFDVYFKVAAEVFKYQQSTQ